MSEGSHGEGSGRLFEDAKAYGLEERTFSFAREIRAFIRQLPRTLCNAEDARQLVRSSGSVGANFIEAAEALGEKDDLFRLRISRKEAKQNRYWLRLLYLQDPDQEKQRQALIEEAKELVLILNSVLSRHKSKPS